MNEKTEPKTWQRVADGIWRRGNSGTLFERPKIANRWTFRSLNTKSIKQAKDELARRVTKRMTGSEPTATVKPTVVTTGQVIRCYEQDGYPDRHKQPRQGRTLDAEKQKCKILMKFWEHILTDNITLALCDRYHEWRKKNVTRGTGNRSVDMELTTLSNAFLWACRKELVRTNPMVMHRPRYRPSKSIRHCREFIPHDAKELHRIAAMLFSDSSAEAVGWQMLFEAYTGLRTGEALQMRVDAKPYNPGWITPDGKSLCVHRSKGQESVNPFVYIHEGLAAWLAAHREWKDRRYPDSPWFFPNYRKPDEKPSDVSALSSSLRRRREKIGRKITSHAMRAYYVTVRRSHGIPDNQIAYEIGHTSAGVTLAAVYGGVPPHWLVGDGPKMTWLPAGQPAWRRIWNEHGEKIIPPDMLESKTALPVVPLLSASPAALPHPVQNTGAAGECPHPTPTPCNEFCPV
ncbi:MAG: site-specific integrase [Verrucomicrobiota bacterium]